MNEIVDEWVKAYRGKLADLRERHPGLSRDWLQRQAKMGANVAVPEGQECLLAVSRQTFRKNGEPMDAYSAELGMKIRAGITTANRDAFGWRKVSRNGAKVPASLPGASPEKEPTHHNVGTKAELAERLAKYRAWAEVNDEMPTDRLLEHFTGVGRWSWRRVRQDTEALGYKYEVIRGGVKVLSRPEPGITVTGPVTGVRVEKVPEDQATWVARIVSQVVAEMARQNGR